MSSLYILSLASLALGSPLTTTNLQQRIPNSCVTRTGDTCVFPFTYLGVTHSQCTYSDSPTPWCATQTDSEGAVVTNKWGDCQVSSLSSCQTESLTSPSCTTESGPRPAQSCVFPFRYLGITYNACTTVGELAPWCSTTTTLAGTHVEGEYGFCPSSCPLDAASPPPVTSCTPGSVFQEDCNTCVCSPEGEAICSTLVCPGATTSTTTSTTTTTTTTTAPPASCSTVSGPAQGASCIFPFTYGGETHSTCAEWVYGGEHQGKFWCSTKVDDFGIHVNGEGNYGFCDSTCSTADPPVSLLDIFGNLLDTNARKADKTVMPGSVVFGSSSSRKEQSRRPF